MADKTLLEIKDRLNIADVISGYIEVKKAGTSYKAVCPFHNEKSPSLHISPQKQIWHCFGCGEGGDVFSFVQKYENMEFRDVVKLLADKAGVKLPEYKPRDKREEDEQDRLTRINNFAAKFYHQMLLKDAKAKIAREYLQKRGLKAETIEQWQIGFAPDDFHALEQALVKNQVPLNDLVKAGVSTKNERGQIYDRFRGRITFPIKNYIGDVVGFSARIMPGEDKGAKYINSPETPIYSKSKVLFGMHLAKNTIRKQDEVIIVEGQMDCISAHQAGFGNVVASSGTALTVEQLAMVGRFTKNLKFCFDADAAGLNATKRAVQQYLGKDFVIKVVVIEDAKDPDELIQKNPAAFKKAVADAPLFLDFYIAKVFEGFDPSSVEQKKGIAKELLPLLKLLSDPLEKEHYVQVLSQKLGTSEKALMQALAKVHSPKTTVMEVKAEPQQPVVEPVEPPSALEKEVLGSLLKYPHMREQFLKESGPEDFDHPAAQRLATELVTSVSIAEDSPNSMLAKEVLFMVELSLEELGLNEDAHQRQLAKSFALLRLNALKKQQKEITTKIKLAEDRGAKQELAELNLQFARLMQARMQYESLL